MSYRGLSYGEAEPGDVAPVERKVVHGRVLLVAHPSFAASAIASPEVNVGPEGSLKAHGFSVPRAVPVGANQPSSVVPWAQKVIDDGDGIVLVAVDGQGYLVRTRDVDLAADLNTTPNSVVFAEPSGGWEKGGGMSKRAKMVVGAGAAVVVLGVGAFLLTRRGN